MTYVFKSGLVNKEQVVFASITISKFIFM